MREANPSAMAVLPTPDEPVEFTASMMAFDGTYTVRAKWSGRETIQYHGADIELWTVDVEWQHIESGDIYPAGPDASGGRYWIAKNPPKGFPYVPRYKTDSYNVEFIRELCPE